MERCEVCRQQIQMGIYPVDPPIHFRKCGCGEWRKQIQERIVSPDPGGDWKKTEGL